MRGGVERGLEGRGCEGRRKRSGGGGGGGVLFIFYLLDGRDVTKMKRRSNFFLCVRLQ